MDPQIVGALCCQHTVEAHYEWKVENFFSLRNGDGDRYDSPDIQFAGSTFQLWLYPEMAHYVVLVLVLKEQSTPIKIRYTLGIKTPAGDTEVGAGTRVFSPHFDRIYCKYIGRSELLKRRKQLAPCDVLNIKASLKTDIGTTEVTVQTSVEDAGGQEVDGGREALENTGTTDVAVQTSAEDAGGEVAYGGRQSMENAGTTDVAGQTCPEDIIDQDGNGCHQTLEKTDFATFCQDIEGLEGKDCDVTLEVRDMKFRVHKFILDDRAPALAAMLSDNASEADTSVVCVEDCHPEAFEVFLRFVYSGVVENLTSENVTDVYYVANKHDLPGLKKECVRHMLSNLTPGSVCSVIDMANRHGEDLLQERASDFLVENAREIFQTAVWRKFSEENSLAYDLYMRVHKNSK